MMREIFRTIFGMGGTLLIVGSIGGLENDYMDIVKFIPYSVLGLALAYIAVFIPEYKKRPVKKQEPVKRVYNLAREK